MTEHRSDGGQGDPGGGHAVRMAQPLRAGLRFLDADAAHELGDVAYGGDARDGPGQSSGHRAVRADPGAADLVHQVELAAQGLGDRDRVPALAAALERLEPERARLEDDVEGAQRQCLRDPAPGMHERRGEGPDGRSRVGVHRGEEAAAFRSR